MWNTATTHISNAARIAAVSTYWTVARSRTATTVKVVSIIGRMQVLTSGKTTVSLGRPDQAGQPISARTSAFDHFKLSVVLAPLLLTSLIGGCSSAGGSTTTVRSVTSTTSSIHGVSNVVGIDSDVRLLTTAQETSVLEVTVATYIRELQQTCPDPQACPEKHVFQVRSSALVDYRLSALGEVDELVVDNEADATSSVAQVLTIENVEPGDHCVAVFSQLLQVDDGTVVGREGLIGTYDHLSLPLVNCNPPQT